MGKRSAVRSTSAVTVHDIGNIDEGFEYGLNSKRKKRSHVAHDERAYKERRKEFLRSMPSSSRQVYLDIALGHEGELDSSMASYQNYQNHDSWVDIDEDEDIPEISHEGGEREDALNAAFESVILPEHLRQYKGYRHRSQRARLKALYKNWDQQMPALTREYLRFKHGKHSDVQVAEEGQEARNTNGQAHVFEVTAIETFARNPRLQVQQGPDELANAALLRIGYLGCSPIDPSLAISLTTLELYHRLKRRHPRLSIESMTRTICDLHDVTYQSWYREQFSIAFDAYLDILRRVQVEVDRALGRDDPLWRMKNVCPCCNYELEGEAPLVPSRMFAMDGNNSMKRVRGAETADSRLFESNYFLSHECVNKYKDEVKRRPKPANKAVNTESDNETSDDDGPGNVPDDPAGDPTDGTDTPTQCTERWKANAAEHEKISLDVYDQTGIFVAACRHGMIAVCCEMVQSGELAKYPLAIQDHLLDVHGEDQASGYDIGCDFAKTVDRSALVGPKARNLNLRLLVNSFHGYAHNRLCQVNNHPLYIAGIGLEDLETMERIFSKSNAVAPTVRHATQFHWMQAIDLHFRQWDEDRYQELTKFLYNNYRQALAIMAEFTPEVEAMKARLCISDSDIEGWLEMEKKYLKELKEEPDEQILKCAYVRALIDCRRADDKWKSVSIRFKATPSNVEPSYSSEVRSTLQLESARRVASEQLMLAIANVGDLESKLGIRTRWSDTDPQYIATSQYMHIRDFHRALDRLQQLVVQRLFELQKANMAGMGYKMRTHIWKALKKRSKAIRTALKQYNRLAPLMKPPAPVLQWKTIMGYEFISDFELLKLSYSRADITAMPWAVPANRETASKYHKILCAKEEIGQANREIRRIRTSIEDEHVFFQQAISHIEGSDPLLAEEIQLMYRRQLRINQLHLRRIRKTEELSGFTGTAAPGTRRGTVQLVRSRDVEAMLDSETESDVPEAILGQQSRSDGSVDVFDNDETNERLVQMAEFIGSLAIDTNTRADIQSSSGMVDGVPASMYYSWKV